MSLSSHRRINYVPIMADVKEPGSARPARNEHQDRKRPHEGKNQNFRGNKRQKTPKPAKPAVEGSHEEILLNEVGQLLKNASLAESASEPQSLPKFQEEVEVKVTELSSTGDGLAVDTQRNHVFVVPFTTPGDVVKARVYKNLEKERYSLADFLSVTEAGSDRDDSLVKCPYFASCSGCQFQMLPYAKQLDHKRRIVEKAYQHFSGLDASLVPPVADTMGSPLQYGYRTKLTPHFDGPPGYHRRSRRDGVKPKFESVPPIGFMKKGTRHTIDIEDCPIGTQAVRMGMKSERKRVANELDKYSRGATILLRESTKRITKSITGNAETSLGEDKIDEAKGRILEDRGAYVHEKTCITDNNGKSTEYVDDYVFENPAGAFFQNNNSILPTFTQYIRDHIFPKEDTQATESNYRPQTIKNLIDAYSGSGLFTITLSSLFERSMGIDIAATSIACADNNLKLNNIPSDRASFIAADAANLFASVANADNKDTYFAPEETVVVIDPPRKGCDEPFLRQLIKYGPARLVYVSCNVHTQARDVGVLVGGLKDVDGGFGAGEGVYEIESVRGFDFFPQTGHVEGVAVLRKRQATIADATAVET